MMLRQIAKGIGLGVLMIAMFFILVYGFQYVWNVTIPVVFGLREITYCQAFGLIIISRVLFGGFGFRWAHAGKGKFWRERVRMKMQNMSDEERDEFKRRLSDRCKEW